MIGREAQDRPCLGKLQVDRNDLPGGIAALIALDRQDQAARIGGGVVRPEGPVKHGGMPLVNGCLHIPRLHMHAGKHLAVGLVFGIVFNTHVVHGLATGNDGYGDIQYIITRDADVEGGRLDEIDAPDGCLGDLINETRDLELGLGSRVVQLRMPGPDRVIAVFSCHGG